MQQLYVHILVPLLVCLLCAPVVVGQTPSWDPESGDSPCPNSSWPPPTRKSLRHQYGSGTTDVLPPPEVRDWTPAKDQFLLYANYDEQPLDSLTPPNIDILDKNQESCVFWMEMLGDTVYLFIVPPQYALHDSIHVRNRVDSLGWEIPLVVWAGTQRASFWLSCDSGRVTLDTLESAEFVSVLKPHELPSDVFTLQLEGNNRNAKIARTLVKELENRAELIQLDDGFYRNIWFKVKRSVLQNWRTNETKTGTLLVFRCMEGYKDEVARILQKYRVDHMSAAH